MSSNAGHVTGSSVRFLFEPGNKESDCGEPVLLEQECRVIYSTGPSARATPRCCFSEVGICPENRM